MKLLPTRVKNGAKKSFKEAVLSPMSEDGGLYAFSESALKNAAAKLDLKRLSTLNYKELCTEIFNALELGIEPKILSDALKRYDNFATAPNPAPLVKFNNNAYFLELYHGETSAFKDMALAPFGALLNAYAAEQNSKFLIICATSGDTGPATLNTFKDAPSVRVICLYPHGKTSEIQRLQMTTLESKNLASIGIYGNFDDAQNALKNLLTDTDFLENLNAKNIKLSAANSVNIGRIAFQIIYHAWGYFELVRMSRIALGESANIIVPSGNFGNILGAFYAKKLGIPLARLVVATNPNSVLKDFINTGIYDLRSRALIASHSPAMDILKSSNVERLLFSLFGAEFTNECMKKLAREQFYALDSARLAALQEHFSAFSVSDTECLSTIKECYESGYILDPHTANGYHAFKQMSAGDFGVGGASAGADDSGVFNASNAESTPTIIASTASFAKFAPSMNLALFNGVGATNELDLLHKIAKNTSQIPAQIKSLFTKKETQKTLVKTEQIKQAILDLL